jgi:hypothetical protein
MRDEHTHTIERQLDEARYDLQLVLRELKDALREKVDPRAIARRVFPEPRVAVLVCTGALATIAIVTLEIFG